MKYLVTECHEGYAVLMDEQAGFVHAANLHYQVGQTVTNPILMQEAEPEQKHITMKKLMPFMAAAACIAVVSAAGFRYYTRNVKTYSVVLMSSDANIKMYLNQQGEVVSLKSDDDYGAALLKHYSAKHKTKIDVANELLRKQIDEGHLTSSDTVDIYISACNDAEFDTYKTEFETEIQQVKVSVQEMAAAPEPPKPVKPDPKAEAKKDPKAEAKKDPKAGPEQDPKAGPKADLNAEHALPDQPDPANAQAAQPAAPKADPPAAVKPGALPKNDIKPIGPMMPPTPPAAEDKPGEEGKTPAVPEPAAPEEKPDPEKDPGKKPDEIDKPDPEAKPDDDIPAPDTKPEKPETPEEQDRGNPVLPAPESGQPGAEIGPEEQEPEEIQPLPMKPEPASGLLPKADPLVKPAPLEAFA